MEDLGGGGLHVFFRRHEGGDLSSSRECEEGTVENLVPITTNDRGESYI